MKKFILSAVIITISSLTLFAESGRKFLGLQFALGTGYPFYGDRDLKSNQNDCMSNGYSRILLYEDFGLTLHLTEDLFVLTGIESMQDWTWKGGYSSNHCNTVFFTGIQFYPGLANLSFSLAYALGFRRDWQDLPSDYNEVRGTKWGNGFRLSAEYDFKKGGGFIPAAGFQYTFLPTGHDNYDNLISLYFRAAFR